jgi:LPS O-antigen subunit length determinant protein (WzzB/FepE family)
MTIEIEQMSARLVEAETKLKTEVIRIKKKLQMQITELEMSLDVCNKNNIELQKTIKRYSIQITVSLDFYFVSLMQYRSASTKLCTAA